MKLLAIILFLTSCSRFIPYGQHQARYVRGTKDTLVFITGTDSIYFLNKAIQRKYFITGDLYIIKYDTSHYVMINGKKHFRATINHNQ